MLLLLLRACACTAVGACVCARSKEVPVQKKDRTYPPPHTHTHTHSTTTLLMEYLVVNTEQQGAKSHSRVERRKKREKKCLKKVGICCGRNEKEKRVAGQETVVKWDPEWSFTPNNNNNNQKHEPESQTVAGTHLAVADSAPCSSCAHQSSLSTFLFYHHNKQREREKNFFCFFP